MKYTCLLLIGLFFSPVLLSQVFKTENIRLETAELGHGFEITGAVDTTENPIVYEQLLLRHNGKKLFFDSTTYFFFTDPSFPLLVKTGDNSFDLLLETDGRPQSNTLTLFKIRNDSIVQRLNFPMFVSDTAANLDEDNTLEYAGAIGFPEYGGTYMPYSPIIYYELLPEGLTIDTSLTESRNALIYGNFWGYEYREDIHQPITRLKLYDSEIKRIKACVDAEIAR